MSVPTMQFELGEQRLTAWRFADMMFAVVSIALLVGTAAAGTVRRPDESLNSHWDLFKSTHAKTYASRDEESVR